MYAIDLTKKIQKKYYYIDYLLHVTDPQPKSAAKGSNIVCQTFEICFQEMFERLATS